MGARASRLAGVACTPSTRDALKAYVNNSPLSVAMTDEAMVFLAASAKWMGDFELPAEALIGKTSYEAAPDTRKFEAAHRRVLEGETLEGKPERLVFPDGEVRWVTWSAGPWRDEKGRIGGILFVSNNVTAQMEAEADARRSRELASMVVEHSPMPMVLKDEQGHVIFMNRAMQRLYGVEADGHAGRKVHEVMDAESARVVLEEDQRALSSEEPIVVEERRTMPGTLGERVMRKTKAAVRDSSGATYLLAISEDITESRRTQDALERTRVFLETVIDNIPSGLTVKNASTGKLLLANSAVARIFGFTDHRENLGRTNEEVFDAETALRFSEREQELARAGGSRFYEADPIRTPEGLRHVNQLRVLVPGGEGDDFILTITDDVTERTRAQGQLKDALARAEAASVAKSEFLANMSHEIRTPLNGVLGLADALARMDLDAGQREIVEMIVSSGKALTGILSDVLDLAKAEAGQLELAREPFSLRETIGSAAFLFQTVASDKGVGFKVEFDPESPDDLLGDPLRIRQVVSNLISNAVKFTAEGEVAVSVSARLGRDGQARLNVRVRDTGPGFDDEVRAKLFSRFEQGDGSITRRYGGTGLGLSIAHALALMMDGEIDCRGRPGKGAVFVFRAPLPLAAAAAGGGGAEPVPAQPERRLRVLLAEDHEINQKVVQLMLGDVVELAIVSDGQAAVERALGDEAFDVVLMDTQMPVMDGLTATRTIRELEARHGRERTPIISLTANAMAHQVQAALDAGADFHLAKPITSEALFGAIDRALDLASRMREANVA
jgi:PAS domain S-box-containing protein